MLSLPLVPSTIPSGLRNTLAVRSTATPAQVAPSKPVAPPVGATEFSVIEVIGLALRVAFVVGDREGNRNNCPVVVWAMTSVASAVVPSL